MASWSPSQSEPLTVSYMCQRQSSSPILPSAAEMPPCAATVWLRVGNTLVMQAVLRPCAAHSSVARKARAAGADDDDVEGVIGDRISSGHQTVQRCGGGRRGETAPTASAKARMSSIRTIFPPSCARSRRSRSAGRAPCDRAAMTMNAPIRIAFSGMPAAVQRAGEKRQTCASCAPTRPSTAQANQIESGTSAAAVMRWRQKCVTPECAEPRPWTRCSGRFHAHALNPP